MANIIYRLQDGTWMADKAFVVTCGCGGIVPDARILLRHAGKSDVPMLVSNSNHAVKDYLQQVGLMDREPSLKSTRHAVLFNPITKRYMNLMKAPRTQTTYDNIKTIVEG